MNKPLEEWDNEYVESLDVTERTTLKVKATGCLNNLGKTIGDVVSAFANFDGGHIIIGADDPKPFMPIAPTGYLILALKGDSRNGWKQRSIGYPILQ